MPAGKHRYTRSSGQITMHGGDGDLPVPAENPAGLAPCYEMVVIERADSGSAGDGKRACENGGKLALMGAHEGRRTVLKNIRDAR